MKFNSKTEAVDFLIDSKINNDVILFLVDIIDDHAIDKSIEIVGSTEDVLCVIFESDHDVVISTEIGNSIISAHCAEGTCLATAVNQQIFKENTMKNAQDINSQIAAEMEAFKAEQRDKFDDAVRRAVEAQVANQPKQEPATKEQPQPTEEEQGRIARLFNGVNTKVVKKVAIYTAGTAAVVAGGWYAWKKFGGGDVVSSIVPIPTE